MEIEGAVGPCLIGLMFSNSETLGQSIVVSRKALRELQISA
jgi:hypothetical protein